MKAIKTHIAQLREDFSGSPARAGIDPLLTAARVLLYVMLVGMIIAQVMSVFGLVVYVIAHYTALLVPPFDPVWRPVTRLLLGLIALGVVQTIIGHVLAMIRSVGRGEAFAAANVGRMEQIAGHVLGLQILGTFAWIIGSPIGGDVNGVDVAVGLSPAGVAFVLLLYILARVFRQGAAMREDLEGTV